MKMYEVTLHMKELDLSEEKEIKEYKSFSSYALRKKLSV